MAWKARIFIDDVEVETREFEDPSEFAEGKIITLNNAGATAGTNPNDVQQVRVASVEAKIHVEAIPNP